MASLAQTPDSSDQQVFAPRGALTIGRAGSVSRELDAFPDPLTIDLSRVERMDTVGAYLVHRAVRDRGARVTGGSQDFNDLLEQVAEADHPARTVPEKEGGAVAELGAWTIESGRTLKGLVAFFGATLIGFAGLIRRPRRFRLNAVIQRFDVVGVRALGIIGLMSFLIGVVIGQQGAVQLQQFGAEVYTVNLIGRITVRELGPLMTAIMVAGRSGSAFAAQIGTMKITEEVDAMRTIGVSPIEALVIPRLIAAIAMMPLLCFWAMLASIVGGGLFCWAGLDIPPLTYVRLIADVVPATDLWVGLIKAPVFGFIIALAGCFQGMLVANDAEQVGLKTTAAVVQSIFLVIVLDAIFAIFFSSIGWI
ncbi:ABC transporter permease [Sphingomonas sp. BN140010]|uniref:ABC transporter permease n=1 Tax=Sphingomonas arvum TaxID=2992113 RepID=A0ABT3JG55_9SPHN|nr:ABC transporter permease [Sphingomonas sp. BN140010]MCW3797984.1 ABC transporter permease [Sphingomonas sp. BN140010]